MKYKYCIVIVLCVMTLAINSHAQGILCPVKGENCEGQLKIFFHDDLPIPLMALEFNFGINDTRNGIYEATSFGENWALFDVNPDGTSMLSVLVSQQFQCNDIPIDENCGGKDCFKCPSEVVNDEQGKMKLVFDEAPILNAADQMKLYISDGNPLNGIYSGTFSTSPNIVEYSVPEELCCGPISGVIEVQEKNCVIDYNTTEVCTPVSLVTPWCGCSQTLQTCSEDILTHLKSTFATTSSCPQWLGSCLSNKFIYHPGLVAVGDVPCVKSGYRLAVNGGIITEHIEVRLCENGGWCDYVFEDDYNLLPLRNVNNFIQLNGHLPNMLSEKEIIEEGGIEMKQTKLDQQVKIEEAFLHLIALNEKITALKDKVDQVKKENEIIRAKIKK